MVRMKKYQKRAFISFDGYCPMNCRHCYTYELEQRMNTRTDIELIEELEQREFDIIYLSQTYENFYEEEKGIDLCKQLYQKYKKDIYIITRSKLSEKSISTLAELNNNMKKNNNQLYFAVSVCANESYGITEDVSRCPSPEERLEKLKQLHEKGVSTILLIRPLFPNQIISVEESKFLIEKSKEYINAVISSGLAVTDRILKKLGMSADKLTFLQNGDSDYLANLKKEQVRYLDVEEELMELETYCDKMKIPFFRHSLPALNNLVLQTH